MRVRINFQKTDEIIYTSALDLQKIWERSIRRALLMVKYSVGFHPQPKMQLAVPLPLGFKGSEELIDIWFICTYPIEEIFKKIQRSLPSGIKLNCIEEISENQKALNGLVESAEFFVKLRFLDFDSKSLENSIQILLTKKVIERTRHDKPYDLRPLVIILEICDPDQSHPKIYMRLLARPGATGRPDEVLKELGIDPALCEIERIKINFKE